MARSTAASIVIALVWTAIVSAQMPPAPIAEFPIPTANSGPSDIALGPDGNLWFTEAQGNRIGRITPAGVITEFPLPDSSVPQGIVAGPDGNMWFAELFGNRIGRITPSGIITEFPLPAGSTGSSQPRGIASGADDNLWFTEDTNGKIGQITPTGTVVRVFCPWHCAPSQVDYRGARREPLVHEGNR